ncbi:MAG: alpha/beta hydrolase [Treponema sp.]|jgi:pimeloyl-ACP methyl ester carboxylesterase|nr:alpha/beta hydrolase [Treponema sp.]
MIRNCLIISQGVSGNGKTTYSSLDEYAQYTAEYIKKRNMRDVVLMGHSLGGGVVSVAENKIKEHLAALILINPISRAIFDASEINKALFPETLEDVYELCRLAYYHFDTMKQAEGFSKVCEETLDSQLRKKEYLRGLFNKINSEETVSLVEQSVQNITTKALYMLGRYDKIVPEHGVHCTASKAMTSSVNPHIEYFVFENSGHCPHNEEPQLFVEQVVAFIQRGNLV